MRSFTLLAFGQSNMHGNTNGEGGDVSVPDGVRVRNIAAGTWVTPTIGAWPLDRVGAQGLPIVPLYVKTARELIRRHGYGQVNIIPVTAGGHEIEAWMTPELRAAKGWPLRADNDDLSLVMYPGIANALNDIGADMPDAVMWHHGEANSGETYTLYRQKFWAVMLELQAADLYSGATVPLVAGELAQSVEWHTDHRTAFVSPTTGLAKFVAGVKFAESLAVQVAPDGKHFTGIGTDTMAQRYVDALFSPMVTL